ncbi:MAG: hypothetical protein PHF84_11045, partial [bacterium]|nr:hypothetical protein [bacterium]
INGKGKEPVSILARHIWLYDEERTGITLNDVYLFTGADNLYNVDEENIRKTVIRGSVTFKNKYKNISKPLELKELPADAALYSGQDLFDIKFLFSTVIRKPGELYIPYIFMEEE